MANFIISGFADEISTDLNEQIQVLQANNIHHIELRGIGSKNVSQFTFDEAKKYKKQLDDQNISVSSIGSPIGKIGINDSFTPHLNLFRHVLEIAKIFRAPYVRMFSFYIPQDEPADKYKDEVIKRWQAFMEIAREYPEVTLLHENEKEIFGDTPERCLFLVETINSPQLRIAFDPANFVQCGVDVYSRAFQLLEPYIDYLHIKDANKIDGGVVPAGYGDGEVAKVLESLINENYNGYLSIEPHLATFSGYENLEHGSVSLTNTGKNNGARTFTIASNALRKILIDQLRQEWH
ncbi:sugar phosphate isomerase/epimerase family protein [Lapidilactobacillus wuchangensis]|uniref:sugar phosphate isomerase/epimerase family protein n=1 Tax=Lapidilactobacillus wuchangensis TaxID=2486001 RepID=UPI000F77D057|nr:TIM barrel protein [Lapidilactobacillus wuchangensis]